MSNESKGGAPAFPQGEMDEHTTWKMGFGGLTVRQYYAAHAPRLPDATMQALGKGSTMEGVATLAAGWARMYADALVKEMEA